MKWVFVSALWMFFITCNKKLVHPNDYNGEKIIFGNGGGFTGAVTSIILHDNGEVFRIGSSDTSYLYLGKLKDNITKNQFLTYETMGFGQLTLNEPGNRYFFITKKANGNEHKILWGKNKLENDVPKLFYDNMMNLVEALEKDNKDEKK